MSKIIILIIITNKTHNEQNTEPNVFESGENFENLGSSLKASQENEIGAGDTVQRQPQPPEVQEGGEEIRHEDGEEIHQ